MQLGLPFWLAILTCPFFQPLSWHITCTDSLSSWAWINKWSWYCPGTFSAFWTVRSIPTLNQVVEILSTHSPYAVEGMPLCDVASLIKASCSLVSSHLVHWVKGMTLICMCHLSARPHRLVQHSSICIWQTWMIRHWYRHIEASSIFDVPH